MLVKMVAVGMLITPFFHLILVHSLKNQYRTKFVVAFYSIPFGVSAYLLIARDEGALALLVCSAVSCLVTIGVRKIYILTQNAVFTQMVETISNAKVLSSFFVTRNKAYALTSKGYIVVLYKDEGYILYENYDAVPDEERGLFSLLTPIGNHE